MKKLTVTDYRKQITALKRERCMLRADLKLALDRERSKDAQASHDFSEALAALSQLLTALYPGPWSPGVVLSYLESDQHARYKGCGCRSELYELPRGISPFSMGYRGVCSCVRESPRWYISLTKFVDNGTAAPPRVVVFKGKYDTPRAAVKAAAEFLLPKDHSALVEQLRKAAEKL